MRRECLRRQQFAAFIGPPAPVQFHQLPRLVHLRDLPQSSSSSRFTAGASGFFILSQSRERPERYGESIPFPACSCELRVLWASPKNGCGPGRARPDVDAGTLQ
jgi:hypothetical protein